MDEKRMREIIREELAGLLRNDRYTFQKLIQIFDGQNIMVGTNNGTKIGTASTQKLAVWGVTPAAQITPSNSTSVASAGAGTTIKVDTTFTGGVGSTVFTVTDIVEALKKFGILKN